MGQAGVVNPGRAIKHRLALANADDAQSRGVLKKVNAIIDPTSGNTDIGLAPVAVVKGHNLMLVMPESMSPP